MPADELRNFASEVVSRARARSAKVLVNGDENLAREVGADGVHLTAMQLQGCMVRPDFALVGASTHDREEIKRAAELKLDFVVLGAVKATLSHPGEKPMGWERFATIVEAAPLPVFALGGLSAADMQDAIFHGAHGVAMQRSQASDREI